MKKVTSILTIFLFLFLFNQSFAQGLHLGIGGGITTMQAPAAYSDNLPSGINIGAKLKIDVPLSPITPIAYINYAFLRSTKSVSGVDVKYSQNILSIGAGGEFSVLPIPGPLSPYISLDVAYNNFGDYKIEGLPLALSSRSNSSSMSRFGLGIGIGTDINLLLLKFDLNAKYNIYNLVGKQDNEDTISSIIVNLYFMF